MADPIATLMGRERSIDLTGHRARSARAVVFERGDLIIAMEPWQVRRATQWLKEDKGQVTLLGLWCSPPGFHLQDPRGLGLAYSRRCFDRADRPAARANPPLRSRD
jgi:protein-tyrosine phosphatase